METTSTTSVAESVISNVEITAQAGATAIDQPSATPVFSPNQSTEWLASTSGPQIATTPTTTTTSLRIRKDRPLRDRRRPCRTTQTKPRFDLLLLGEPCAIDAEFQRFRVVDDEGNESKCINRRGRLSIVNTRGDVVLDVYCRYEYVEHERKVISRRDAAFLVERDDFLKCNGAVEAGIVEPWVQQIVADRTLILHGGKQDLDMFQIVDNMWAKSTVDDTQRLYSSLQRDGTPGLRTCATEIFGTTIQEAEHSSVEDAAMTMRLYQNKVPFDRQATQRNYDATQPKFTHIGHNFSTTSAVSATVPAKTVAEQRRERAMMQRFEEMSLEEFVVVKIKPAKGKKKGRKQQNGSEEFSGM